VGSISFGKVGIANQSGRSWKDTVRQVAHSLRNLPRPIQLVCNVIFFAWMGWFPFLFYSTTWVSSIYYQTHPDQDSTDWTKGARAGSFALLCYAVVSVISGVTLPTLTTHSIPHITLKNVWTFSLLVFSFTMLLTQFVTSVTGATVILALLGISWACIMWIPFALIGEYLHVYGESQPTESEATVPVSPYGAITHATSVGNSSLVQHILNATEPVDSEWLSCSNCEPGMVLGVLNMYVVFPQFAVALIASSIFYLVDVVDGEGIQDNSTHRGISILLQVSGLMALIAAGLSRYVIDVAITRGKFT